MITQFGTTSLKLLVSNTNDKTLFTGISRWPETRRKTNLNWRIFFFVLSARIFFYDPVQRAIRSFRLSIIKGKQQVGLECKTTVYICFYIFSLTLTLWVERLAISGVVFSWEITTNCLTSVIIAISGSDTDLRSVSLQRTEASISSTG